MPKRVSVTLADAVVTHYDALPHHQRSKTVNDALLRYFAEHAPADVPVEPTTSELLQQIVTLRAEVEQLRASVTNHQD